MAERTSLKTALALLAVGGVGLASCEQRSDGRQENIANQAQTAPEPSVLPQPEPVLDRQALLGAVAEAASAFAAGASGRAARKDLAGRQFSFRIAFGCSGPAQDIRQSNLAWFYDAEGKALRIRATPDINLESAWVEAMAGADVEAVQGFWIERPWLLEPICRRDEAPASPDQRQLEVGIAQFFTSEDSRVQLRSRPFEAVQKVHEKGLPGVGGLHLVVSGRMKELSDGRVIACMATNPNRRPVCIASVEFDRVVVEDVTSQAVIAEWGGG